MKVKELEKFKNKIGLKGCKWSSLDAPGTQTPLCHAYWEMGNSPNSHNWPSGVIRMGSPVWKWKSWKNSVSREVLCPALFQFECPRHSKPSVSFSFGVGWIPFSHYWPSGVKRIGLPVWKWKSWKYWGIKVALRDANDSDWMARALKLLCLIQFWGWKNPLFPLLVIWGNKNWPPSMKIEQNWFKGLQMIHFKCPRH